MMSIMQKRTIAQGMACAPVTGPPRVQSPSRVERLVEIYFSLFNIGDCVSLVAHMTTCMGCHVGQVDSLLGLGTVVKVQVKVKVYSLASSAKRLHTLTRWSQYLFIHKPPQPSREHIVRLPYSAHGTIQTHKPSLLYQIPPYPWVSSVHA